jgi:carbonic anhydrase/acetyltransferase-like protein (isoleucine patch superfamily)
MSTIAYKDKKPRIKDSVFLAPDVWVIGDAVLGEDVNIWNGAIIRGDDDSIRIGPRTSILENCVVEAPTGLPVSIGKDSIISHGAIIHGARIGDSVMVGIGAIVLDGARIGDGSIIGSGALVPPNKVITPGSLAMGFPAKVERDVREREKANVVKERNRLLEKAAEYRIIYEEA